MIKRIVSFILTIVLLFSLSSTVFACDENQTNTYVTQILFGDSALSKANDQNVKMLLSALYLCSEQSDNQGQDEIDYLKASKVSGVPSLSALNIKNQILMECSHNAWEYEFSAHKKAKAKRKKVLQNTVNKVFDFGFINNLFGSKRGKCNSFAALLYYSHILADYLADDPDATEVNVNGKMTPAYAGAAYTEINGNRPSFTAKQKKKTESFVTYSDLDDQGRAGIAYGCIGPDILNEGGDDPRINSIYPSGWNQNEYNEVGAQSLFHRCHLIAHVLGGIDQKENLITGTSYMNGRGGMEKFELDIKKCIKEKGYHVLYRVTPVYKGYNKVASGVKMEAYSVEDSGTEICINRYFYNVQPGIRINYATGENELSDLTVEAEHILPFATGNPSDNNPDLIYEMNKHFAILFEDQKSSGTYTLMMDKISSIAADARAVGKDDKGTAQNYILMKKYEYKYLKVLKSYVPQLLNREDFFSSIL